MELVHKRVSHFVRGAAARVEEEMFAPVPLEDRQVYTQRKSIFARLKQQMAEANPHIHKPPVHLCRQLLPSFSTLLKLLSAGLIYSTGVITKKKRN